MMGPTILKLGVMGRTHSTAQCAGTIVSTSRLRSAGASGWKECSLLANKSAPSAQYIHSSITVQDASVAFVVCRTPRHALLPSAAALPLKALAGHMQMSDHDIVWRRAWLSVRWQNRPWSEGAYYSR